MIAFAIWQSRLLWLSFRSVKEEESELPPRVMNYLERQHRRRIQMSILMGCAGICMIFGIYIPARQYAAFFVLAWILTVGFLCWTILIAVIDAISINVHHGASRRKDAAEQAKLRYQLEQKVREKLEQMNREQGNSEQGNKEARRDHEE